jgi:hypothetical protein
MAPGPRLPDAFIGRGFADLVSDLANAACVVNAPGFPIGSPFCPCPDNYLAACPFTVILIPGGGVFTGRTLRRCFFAVID